MNILTIIVSVEMWQKRTSDTSGNAFTMDNIRRKRERGNGKKKRAWKGTRKS